MKKAKLYLIILLVMVISGIGYSFIASSIKEKNAEELNFTEIKIADDVTYTTLEIAKGNYEEGDMIYLTYYEETETSFNFLFENVYALEDGDVIAVHELNKTEAETLKTQQVNIDVEVMLTEEEVNDIGKETLEKHIRMEKLQNNNEEQKNQIRTNYYKQQSEYMEAKNQKQMNDDPDFENGNSENNSVNGNNDNNNSNGQNN